MAQNNKDTRRLPLFRCLKFNCSRSVDKWQCCHYCENVKRCERKCTNGALTCRYLEIDKKVTNY